MGHPLLPKTHILGSKGSACSALPPGGPFPLRNCPGLGRTDGGVVSHGTSPPKSPLWFSALLPGSNMEKRDVRVSGSHFPGPFCALFPALSGDSPSETWTDGRNGGWILGVPAGLLPGGSRRLILTQEACAGR